MVDEAQHLTVEALDQVRSIFDAANVGIVLAGNRDLDTHMGLERRRDQLAQIASRVGIRFRRDRPLKADIGTLLDAWQVTGEAERAELTGVALQPGGMRGLTMTLRIAFGLAAAGKVTLASSISAWPGRSFPEGGRERWNFQSEMIALSVLKMTLSVYSMAGVMSEGEALRLGLVLRTHGRLQREKRTQYWPRPPGIASRGVAVMEVPPAWAVRAALRFFCGRPGGAR